MIQSSSLVPPAALAASLPTILLLAKVTIVLLGALAVTVALRHSSSSTRHLVWLVALGALLILPALAAWGPLRIAILPDALTPSRAVAVSRPGITNPGASRPTDIGAVLPQIQNARTVRDGRASTVIEQTPAAHAVVERGAASTGGSEVSEGTGSGQLGLSTLLLGAWGAIALVLALWLTHGSLAVRRIVRRARPLDTPAWRAPLFETADRLGMPEPPRLLRSDAVKMPFACGLVHPTIVLPAESDDWSIDRRRAVLLHELAHVRRRDLLGHMLGRLACALYWFHPLVWTAARRLRAESERACDDLALSCGARASDYAEHLLDIVSSIRRPATPALALAMARRKEFEGRMLAILDPELRRAVPSRAQSAILVGGLAVLSLVVGAAAPVTGATPPNGPRTAAQRAARADSISTPRDQEPRQADMKVIPEPRTSEPQTDRAVRSDSPRTGNAMHHPAARAPEERDRMQEKTATSHEFAFRLDSAWLAVTLHLGTRNTSAAGTGATSDDRVTLLANVLRTDTSAALRRVAAWGLAQYAEKSDVAAAALATALEHDASPDVREMAAWALEEGNGGTSAIEALEGALRRDTANRVRATAAWALGQLGDEDAIDALSAALTASDDAIRVRAAWALGQIEPRRAPQALITLLGDREPKVRKVAAWALSQIRDPDAVAALDAALTKESDAGAQRAEVRALAALGERSVDAVKRLIDSPNPEVRSMAIRALAGGGAGPWPWPWPDPRPWP